MKKLMMAMLAAVTVALFTTAGSCATTGINLPEQTDRMAAKYPMGPQAVEKIRDFLGLHYDDPKDWEIDLSYFDGDMKPVKGPITRVENRKRVTKIDLPTGRPVTTNDVVIPAEIIELLQALTNAPAVNP